MKAFHSIILGVATFVCAGACNAATITSTYTFTGDCTDDCTGQATATLVLQNYTQGDPLDISNFVSFSYTSNLLEIESDSIGDIFGSIPASLPGPADVEIEEIVVVPDCPDCNTYDFSSHINDENNWDIGVDDSGSNGIWAGTAPASGAPEPASAATLGIGLAALAAWRLRRNIAARQAAHQ